MKLSIPQFDQSLVFPPSLVDEQTVNHTSRTLLTTSFLGSLDHLLRDNLTMRSGNLLLGQLAWYAFFDQVSKTERNFGNGFGGNGGLDRLFMVTWENLNGVGVN